MRSHHSSAIESGVGRRLRDPEGDALTALLTRVATGDVSAFAALYDQTSARLFGVAQRILRDPHVAQETIFQVYLSVWADAHLFHPCNGSPQAWLMSLAQARAVDQVRQQPEHRRRTALGTNGSPADEIDGEAYHLVYAGFASLDERQWETVALAYYGALTCQEMAELHGVPLPTITLRLRTALARLRESLGTR